MDTTLKHLTIREAMEDAYVKFINNNEGKCADYIPYLANADNSLFAITVCMSDGMVMSVGDSTHHFGIESISKVPTALLAMEQCGAGEVLSKIGADATGLPFNSIMAILLEANHPSTPLVNAGAISACSMIEPRGESDKKWDAIINFISDLTSSKVELIDELYQSETETNHRNRSIAWLLKSYDRIYDDVETALDLYTRQCSLGVSTQHLAIMAATIAHGGVNPLSKKQVFKPSLSQHIVSMMASVGMYEHSGNWMFKTGIPAKSGVGGAIMGVIPGVMGICAFSPALDESGNSVRAQLAIEHISKSLNLSIYAPYRCTIHQHEFVYV